MKRLLPVIIVLTLLLTACSATAKKEAEQTPPPPEVSATPSAEPTPAPDKEVSGAELIETTYEVDTVLSQVVFTTQNNSKATFSGDIFFCITSGTTDVDGGNIKITDLPAGQSAFTKMDVSTTDNLFVSTEVTKATFAEVKASSGGEYDEEASKKLKEDFDSSFGYEEFATSWHKYVDNISIYAAGDRYVDVIVNGGDADQLKTISNCIFANYKNDYNFEYLVMHNKDGVELLRKEQ